MKTQRDPQGFAGTPSVHLFFALEESIKMIEEEGLDAIFARHRRLADATRAAVMHWGAASMGGANCGAKGIGGKVKALELFCADPSRLSDSVTAVIVPDGHDAN